jgi:hypothetical protein
MVRPRAPSCCAAAHGSEIEASVCLTGNRFSIRSTPWALRAAGAAGRRPPCALDAIDAIKQKPRMSVNETKPTAAILADLGISNTDAEQFPPPEFVDASKAPEAIMELVAACIRFVHQKYRLELDFSLDTLSYVDQYARDSRAGVSVLPAALELVGTSIGAYLGEVMRRHFGGFWLMGEQSSGPQGHMLCMSEVFLSFSPLAMGVEAVADNQVAGWDAVLRPDPALKGKIEERLNAMPAIEEEAFYLPSTRIEVVEAVVEYLRAIEESKNALPRKYLPEDYAEESLAPVAKEDD